MQKKSKKPTIQQIVFKILKKVTDGQYGKNIPTKEENLQYLQSHHRSRPR